MKQLVTAFQFNLNEDLLMEILKRSVVPPHRWSEARAKELIDELRRFVLDANPSGFAEEMELNLFIPLREGDLFYFGDGVIPGDPQFRVTHENPRMFFAGRERVIHHISMELVEFSDF
jgi:hypothetical protein